MAEIPHELERHLVTEMLGSEVWSTLCPEKPLQTQAWTHNGL